MPLGLGVGVTAIGDRLCVSFRYRWALWSADAAGRFATMLEDELVEVSA